MTNEKITATVETPATETATKTAKKINLKKEVKTAPALVEVDPATVEAKKIEITRKIDVLNIRVEECEKTNKDGESINATNWSKDETSTGNKTVGGLLRKRWNGYLADIKALKLELKQLYFTLDPVLAGLLTSENKTVVSLVNACIENMRNVVVIANDEQTDVEAIKILYNAGIERIGVGADYDCNKVSRVLRAGGYKYWDADEGDGQPAKIEAIKIAGLDPVPACEYFVYIRK